MHKKYHKLHRHKDVSHKRSSKSKIHHKHKKEQRPTSQSVLEPIQEVSKEKVRIDKHACGDFVQKLLLPQFEDNQKKKKSKGHSKKNKISEKVEKLSKEDADIFSKNYLQKLRESSKQKPVRHHSLEKSGESLIDKTRNLFRKEKSFNDAVKKMSDDLELQEQRKNDRKRRHRSRKIDDKSGEGDKEQKKRRKNHEKKVKDDIENTERKLKNKEEKRSKSSNKKTKTDDKSVAGGKNVYSRVQEVIYCQLDQVPYKLKNDKSGSEIKNLYQRMKREKRRDKEEDGNNKNRSHSHGDSKRKYVLERERSYHSHQVPITGRVGIPKERKHERPKSRTRKVLEEFTQQEDRRPDKHSKDSRNKEATKSSHRHRRDEEYPPTMMIKTTSKKRKKSSLSNIDLGPYDKYFAFENQEASGHRHKDHCLKRDEHRKSSRDKKHRKDHDEIVSNLEDIHGHNTRKHERYAIVNPPVQENKSKIDEDKIHQIIEGDIKSYFGKIQHMIDQKLDCLLQATKSKHGKVRDKSKEGNRKRSKSKEKQSDKEKQNDNKKDDKDKNENDDKTKHDIQEGIKENIAKEDIVQEVLKRLKKETEEKRLKELQKEHKEKPSTADKEVGTKHNKMRKDDRSHSVLSHPSEKKVQDSVSDRKSFEKRKYPENVMEKRKPRSEDKAITQKSSNKKHLHGDTKMHRQTNTELKKSRSHRSPDGHRHYHETEVQTSGRSPEVKRTRHRESSDHHNERKDRRSTGSPDKIGRTRHVTEGQDTSPARKKHRSPEKDFLPRDSLLHTRKRIRPNLELVIPEANHVCRRGDGSLSHHSLRKHYTSASSFKVQSDHHIVPPEKSRIASRRSEQVVTHGHDQKPEVSSDIRRERRYLDYRRRSSSPERFNRRSEEISTVKKEEKHMCEHIYDKNNLESHIEHQQEHVVVPRFEDYIMVPKDHRKPKEFTNIEYYRERMHSPERHRLVPDKVVQGHHPYLENIILPPEMFRTSTRGSPERQYPRQEFLVQGIEPPILECSRKKSEKKIRVRSLECKTVSIIRIPPQIPVKELPLTNQTQTSSKSRKSTPDPELVEKRKQSKRFKLYYKYSFVNNIKEDKDSGTSDAKSIVSDSYRVLSDPSEEERAAVYYSGDGKKGGEHRLVSETSQVINIVPKKFNRTAIATPIDSHLNNIIEEPSNISTSINKEDYFIPIRDANECYFRALTSSHSEYCFKINKKPANSNISIQSKDTYDGRYRYYEDAKCRYCKHDMRSKSDFNMAPNERGIHLMRSKSRVFLGGNSGKKAIKSIFLEDTHPYVRTRRDGVKPTPHSAFKNLLEEKDFVVKTCKDCQTSDTQVNDELIAEEKEKSRLAMENKVKQFKAIYKTIDDLEENIHNSRTRPPQKTLDIAVSSKFLSLDEISDKKPQFKEIYRTIEKLQDTMVRTPDKTVVDVAIGSSKKPGRCERGSGSEPRKVTREISIGDSKEKIMAKTRITNHRSESRGRRLKSTGVSPIRIIEDLQISTRSPAKKETTPVSPVTKPCAVRPFSQRRSKDDEDQLRKTVPKVVETKKESSCRNSLRQKVILVKDIKLSSPEKTKTDKIDQKDQKDVDTRQPPVQTIRVMRSEEKSENLKQINDISKSRSRDRKPIEDNAKSSVPQNQTDQKKDTEFRGACFIVDRPEVVDDVGTRPKNKIKDSSKSSARRDASKDKRNVTKKPPSSNYVDDMHRSCVHHYHPRDLKAQKISKTVDNSKTPEGTTSRPVTVNAAIFECQPSSVEKSIAVEGSTSSSLGDESVRNIKRSTSLVELRNRQTNLSRSKSEIVKVKNVFVISKTNGRDTNGGSVISGNMEKYTNRPRLRCQSSKSNVHLLDQLMNNKFTSRLFLTKDYKGAEISAYQRRKLYDQSIRQKMKKKFRYPKMDVGPQIFEVRFLSMVNQENYERKEREVKAKNYFNRPLLTLSMEKLKKESRVCIPDDYVNSSKNGSEIKTVIQKELIDNNNEIGQGDDLNLSKEEQNSVVTEQNLATLENVATIPVNSISVDEKRTNYIKRTPARFDDTSVTELYFKDDKVHQDKLLSFCNKLIEVNSSLGFQEEFKGTQCSCSKFSENCESCKRFVKLMDMLCCSIASYCDSKNNLVDFNLEFDSKCEESTHNSQSCKDTNEHSEEVCKNSVNEVKDESDNLHVHLPNFVSEEVSNNVEEIFSRCRPNTCDNSNISSVTSDKIFKNFVDFESFSSTEDSPALVQPLSCPVLPNGTSSFDYLYEETSSDNEAISREIILADLTRPFDQTFSFSMRQYNVETPFCRRNGYFSATGSLESGYASTKSITCKRNSLTDFFKKPNIAALFKPPVLTKKKIEMGDIFQHRGQGDFEKSSVYKEMTKSCQLYAKKVRECCETKFEDQNNEYQEFSLAFLLGRNSSVVLQTEALSQQSRIQNLVSANGVAGLAIEEIVDSVLNKEGREAVLDIGDANDDFSKISEKSFVENGCRLVLSNECLKIDSITYLGPEIFTEDCPNLSQKISKLSQKDFSVDLSKKEGDKEEDSSFTLDFSLDSNNPFLPSKDTVTQKFFASLLKVYEKEMELCNELFKNDEFLKNVLLPAAEERKKEEKKNKKGIFGRFFRKKGQEKNKNAADLEYEQKSNKQIEASTKLKNLAFNIRKCFTMLAEAVKINENIDDEIKICGVLKLLERIESGDFHMLENNEDSNFKEDIKSQVKEAFINIYELCQKEAKKTRRNIGGQEINLIKAFVSKYRIGLLPKTDIVACYIGRGIIRTETQLKAAVTYLMRSQSSEVNINKFEEYCKFTKTLEK